MSAQRLLQAAIVDALSAHAPLADAVNGVFDAPPVRAALPYALVSEPVLTDWSTKDMAGREARSMVNIHDVAERPVRLRDLIGAAEDALAGGTPAIGEGWRIVSLSLLRSRIIGDGDQQWIASSEFRVRMLREN